MVGYVTLPSNGFDFPENTLSTYTVRLERPLVLEAGQWEVGLADMQYPTSWVNVPDGIITYSFTNAAGAKEEMGYYVRPGRYSTHGELIKEFNRVLISYNKENDVSMYYDTVRNKTFLTIKDEDMALTFTNDLAEIFGLDPLTHYGRGQHRSSSAPDINRGFTSLYVYSDIAEPRAVGDALAPLLRVVPTARKKFVDAYTEFSNIQYMPVSNTQTDLIQVLLRRDNGKEIPFTAGKVVITLHFRRVRAET